MTPTTTTLQTDHGTFVCAEEGGGTEGVLIPLPEGEVRPEGLATADRPQAGAWETFTVHRGAGDVVYLQSCGDAHTDPPRPPMFGCAEHEGQDGIFVFNRPTAGAWEALLAREQPDGRVCFEVECRPGHYLCAEPDGRLVIRQPMWEDQPAPDNPGGWESFTASVDLFPPTTGGGGSEGLPLAGPVRILNEVFSDDNGAFIPIGCHFGEAFSAWCHGRRGEVQAQVRTIRQAGYDHIRVWLNLGFYPVWRGREVAFVGFTNKAGAFIPQTPHYSDERLAFDTMLVDEGMRGLFSRGDMNSMREQDIQAHLHEERRILSHHPQIHFGSELANEKWQNAPSSIAENEPKSRQMMEAAFGGTGWLLQNSCPPGSGEEPKAFAQMVQEWFPCQPVHGTREFSDMEKVLRRHFNYGYERYPAGYGGKRYAMQSTEPGGPGQGVSVGNTSDLWKIMAMHAATLIGRTATVYMSGHGVFWNGPIESQPGFWEVAKLRTIFAKNAFLGSAVHGGRAEAWVTSAGGFTSTYAGGYARVDQLIYANECVAIAHSGGTGRKLQFKIYGTASIRNFDLTERQAFDVDPGAVHDVGGDCLVLLRRR